MRKLKKAILCMLCIGVIGGVTACGTANDGRNNAADHTATDRNAGNNTDNGGVINDLGNAAEDGVRDVERGIDNLTDGTNDNVNNHATTKAEDSNR